MSVQTVPVPAPSRELRAPSLLQLIAAVSLVVGLACTVTWFASLDGFWEDEFFPIAFINEPLSHFLVAVTRLDPHPPLYYLQVKLWGTFFGSDKALLLNSVLWHVASCAGVYFVARSLYGQRAALIGVAVYALIPQVVWASVTLRAYAMLPLLAVLTFWLNVQVLGSRRRSGWWWLLLALVELAIGFSHAIGFYFVAWIAATAALGVKVDGGEDAPWRKWMAVQGLVAVALLPLLLHALVRDGGTGDVDPFRIGSYLGAMVAGWGMRRPVGLLLGAALYMLALGLGLAQRSTRVLTVGLLVAPLAVAMLVTLMLKPLFKTPIFSAMTMPFLAIVLGAGFAALPRRLAPILASLMLVAMAFLVFPATNVLLTRDSPWRPVALELQRNVKPGDVVVVPKSFAYWAVLRYAVGAKWGAPLEVMPLRPEGLWARVVERLGPDTSTALKLVPRTDRVVHDGVTYVVGADASRDSSQSDRVWVVQRLAYATPVLLAEGFSGPVEFAAFGDRERVELQLFERR